MLKKDYGAENTPIRLSKQNTFASPYDDGVAASEDVWSEVGSEIGSPKGNRATLKLFTGDEDE